MAETAPRPGKLRADTVDTVGRVVGDDPAVWVGSTSFAPAVVDSGRLVPCSEVEDTQREVDHTGCMRGNDL